MKFDFPKIIERSDWFPFELKTEFPEGHDYHDPFIDAKTNEPVEPIWPKSLSQIPEATQTIVVMVESQSYVTVDLAFNATVAREMTSQQRRLVMCNVVWEIRRFIGCKLDERTINNMRAAASKTISIMIGLESRPGNFGQEDDR